MTYYEEKITLLRNAEVRGGFVSTINRAFANLARFRVEAGTIETIDIWADFPSAGLKRFTARKNGADLFPVIGDQMDLADAAHVGKTGLAIVVADGDLISFDLNAIEGTLNFPVYFRIGYVAAGGGGSTVGIFSPDPPYAVPSTEDDEFNAAALAGKWATANGASTIHTDFSLDNHVGVYCVEGNFNGLKQSTSNVDQSIRAKFRSAKDGSGTVVLGLFFKGGSNNIVEYVFQGATYNFYKGVYTGGVASSGAFTGVSGGAFFNDLNHFQEFWLELKYTASGHTVDGLISLDGVQFYPMFTAQNLGANVTEMGISVHGSSTLYSYIDWFRKLQGSFTGGSI